MVVRRALLVIAAVAFLAGCWRTDEPSQGSAAPAQPVAVAVTTVARRPVPRVLEAVGTVRARKQSVLSSRIVAAVVAVHVVETHASLAARRRQMAARIEQADAEVTSITVATGYTKVLAPFDGVVVAKPAEVGSLAAPGSALLVVEEERYRLEVNRRGGVDAAEPDGRPDPVFPERAAHRAPERGARCCTS